MKKAIISYKSENNNIFEIIYKNKISNGFN